MLSLQNDITYLSLNQRAPKKTHWPQLRGAEFPTYPDIFYRCATVSIVHNQPIIRPECSDKLDDEAELVAIVG